MPTKNSKESNKERRDGLHNPKLRFFPIEKSISSAIRQSQSATTTINSWIIYQQSTKKTTVNCFLVNLHFPHTKSAYGKRVLSIFPLLSLTQTNRTHRYISTPSINAVRDLRIPLMCGGTKTDWKGNEGTSTTIRFKILEHRRQRRRHQNWYSFRKCRNNRRCENGPQLVLSELFRNLRHQIDRRLLFGIVSVELQVNTLAKHVDS